MLEKQTLSYIGEINDILKYYSAKKYNIWYIIECLEDIVDESDPDTSLPQIHHAYQTAIMLKDLYISYDYSLKYINIRSYLMISNGTIFHPNINLITAHH